MSGALLKSLYDKKHKGTWDIIGITLEPHWNYTGTAADGQGSDPISPHFRFLPDSPSHVWILPLCVLPIMTVLINYYFYQRFKNSYE